MDENELKSYLLAEIQLSESEFLQPQYLHLHEDDIGIDLGNNYTLLHYIFRFIDVIPDLKESFKKSLKFLVCCYSIEDSSPLLPDECNRKEYFYYIIDDFTWKNEEEFRKKFKKYFRRPQKYLIDDQKTGLFNTLKNCDLMQPYLLAYRGRGHVDAYFEISKPKKEDIESLASDFQNDLDGYQFSWYGFKFKDNKKRYWTNRKSLIQVSFINHILKWNFELKTAHDNSKSLKTLARKSAFAEVNARTTSHNTGSHILTNDLTKQEDLLRFHSYLRQRMLYNSDITSDIAYYETDYTLRDIVKEFESLNVVTNYISGIKDCSFRRFILPTSIKNEKLSLPNGILGLQAIFVIFENIIRNYFKHGNDKKTKLLEIKIDKKKETKDFVCLAISDGSSPSKAQFKRIQEMVSGQILDESSNKLRTKGLGFLEMRGAASYLNKISIENIDEYSINFGKRKQKVLEVKRNRNGELIFELWLRKSKSVIVFIDKIPRNQNELNKKGIYFETESNFDNKPHQWVIIKDERLFDAVIANQSSLSPKIFLVEKRSEHYPTMTKERYLSLINSPNDIIVGLYEDWAEFIRQKNNFNKNSFQIVTDKDGNSDLPIYMLWEGDPKKIVFDNHGSGFFRNKDSFYYEPFASSRGFGKLINKITFLPDGQKKYFNFEIFESVCLSLGILDERVQKRLGDPVHSGWITRNASSDQEKILFSDIANRMNIYVPDPDPVKGGVNLNIESYDNDFERAISDWIKNQNDKFDYLVIHLGIIEKILSTNKKATKISLYKPDVRSWMIKNIHPYLSPSKNTILILTSDRGRPDNTPDEYRFIPYSNLSKYLFDELSKYHLTKILISSRKNL